MRLFVAVDLDEQVRRAAGRLARVLRARLEQLEQYGVSWVAPENMHVTLRFLGEVREDVAQQVEAALKLPFGLPEFELEVRGIGTFPPSGSARVVWFGITAGAEELSRLHDEVEVRLRPFGFPEEGRAFRAHLTVGRFRVPAPARVRDLAGLRGQDEIGRCRVGRVTLYRSQLSPRGAVYTPLVRAPLGTT